MDILPHPVRRSASRETPAKSPVLASDRSAGSVPNDSGKPVRRGDAGKAASRPAADPATILRPARVRTPGRTQAASRTRPDVPLAIVYRALRELLPYVGNSRTHTARQIAKLTASLARFGWTNPILIADNGIIAGHARLRAAIGMAEKGAAIPRNPDPWAAPTIDLSALSPEERRAYVIADNRLAEDAGWDRDLLLSEMTGLRDGGFDLSLTGFNTIELTTMFGTDNSGAGGQQLDDGMQFQVIVECDGEAHQAAMMERLKAEGLKCRPLIL
jgi:hypothetical protein